MKLFRLGALSAFALSMASVAVAENEWNNINVIQVNTEEPSVTHFAYNDLERAKTFLRDKSQNVKLLNGNWKFNWSKNPASRPTGFYKTDFNDSSWDTIKVPSNWEVEGFGTAIYTNIAYPFKKDQPNAPKEDNPIGSYRTDFTVPANFKGKETFISFDGVSSAFYIWVNGKKVGYSQGSRTEAKFNISKYLKPGTNQLAVEVYRWCDGSYLEDQDFWRLSGIFRDVYLQARTPQHIRDFHVTTDLDENFDDAKLLVDVEVTKPAGTVELSLFDAEGKAVFPTQKKPAATKTSFAIDVDSPKHWNAETPYLYDAFLTLKDKSGKVLEIVPQKVGFREVYVKGPNYFLNGKKILLKGVNRHETHPDFGQYVDRESIIKDIQLMKQNNINAIRTSHYPNLPLFYDLCNEYGIYVWDEANIESHGMGYGKESLAKDPKWKTQHLDRLNRMVARDRNHPSVITWSMGNEAGDGINFKAGYELIKANDPTRPVHYERSSTNNDLLSWMYTRPNGTAKHAKGDRPFIICEYTHAMGNSNGNLAKYWDIIYQDNAAQGGFVWDWMDQGLRKPIPEQYKKNIGKGPVKDHAFAYGGWDEDFAGRPKGTYNDGNFCMNGLISSDWTPHPGLFAIKYAYRNVHISAKNLAKGQFFIKNFWHFTQLDQLVTGDWVVTENGKEIAKGQIADLAIAPETTKDVALNLPSITPKAGAEYFVTLRFHATKSFSPLVKEGYELDFAQFKLPVAEIAATTVKPTGSLKVIEQGQAVTVKSKGFTVSFDKSTGLITNYEANGQSLIKRGPLFDTWRAYTDNDKAPLRSSRYSRVHRDAVSKQKIADVKVTELENAVRITVKSILPTAGAGYEKVYTIYANQEIDVDVRFQKTTKGRNPHRIGTELIIPAKFDQMTWYGRGPHPTYIDRDFERIGIFSGSVDEQWIEYSRPQANGNKTDVRWVTMTDKKGNGLLFSAEGAPLSVGAKFYCKETIENTKYSFQMERSEDIFLNIDHKQLGVGGDDSWGATAHPEYQLNDKEYTYSYRIRPITAGQDVDKLLNKAVKALDVKFTDLADQIPELPDFEVQGNHYASSFEGHNPMKNAFDGNPNTRWCAAGPETPQWIATDLDEVKDIKSIEILWEKEDNRYDFTIEISNDTKIWDVLSTQNQKGDKVKIELNTKARYIRVKCTKIRNGSWASIREIKINH